MHRQLFALLLALLSACGATSTSHAPARPDPESFALVGAVWSPTHPPINETHVFEGEINNNGNPVGSHSRPGGHDPANARVVRVTQVRCWRRS